jgi:hypothetical protein
MSMLHLVQKQAASVAARGVDLDPEIIICAISVLLFSSGLLQQNDLGWGQYSNIFALCSAFLANRQISPGLRNKSEINRHCFYCKVIYVAL